MEGQKYFNEATKNWGKFKQGFVDGNSETITLPDIKEEFFQEEEITMDINTINEEVEEFVAERIYGKRVENGDLQYLIKWKGYPPEDNTWEAFRHIKLGKGMEAVELFEKGLIEEAERNTRKRSLRTPIKPEAGVSSAKTPTKMEPGVSSARTPIVKEPSPKKSSSGRKRISPNNKRTGIPTKRITRELFKNDSLVMTNADTKKKSRLGIKSNSPDFKEMFINTSHSITFPLKDEVGASWALAEMVRCKISNYLTKGFEPTSIVGLINLKGRLNHLVTFDNGLVDAIPVPYMRHGYPQLLIDFYEKEIYYNYD